MRGISLSAEEILASQKTVLWSYVVVVFACMYVGTSACAYMCIRVLCICLVLGKNPRLVL